MSIDRRKFVKLAGVGVAAVAAKPATDLLARTREIKSQANPGETLPQENPATARRWAMTVDMRKVTHQRIEKVIDACHELHNVPKIKGKDEIKWIWEEHFAHAFHEQDLHYVDEALKHLPTPLLCNHCDDPPCTRVCPTQATWKRESDGIVMMDWHRCIGCRYCVVACPYGSRSFNFRDPRPHIEGPLNAEFPTRMRGVVEKCTFCEERLSRGEMPACVEASEGMLSFGDLEDPNSDVSRILAETFSIRRKPALGTQPQIYYVISAKPGSGDGGHHDEQTMNQGGSHD